MKKSKTMRSLLCFLLAFTSLLTACSSPTTAEESTTSADTATTTTTSSGDSGTVTMPVSGIEVDADIFAEPISINYLGYRYDLIDKMVEFLNEMEQIPTVTVEEVYDYNMESMFNLACAAGGDNPYSIVNVAPQGLHLFTDLDYLQPLDEYIEKYWDDYNFGDIPEEYWEWVTVDGHIYGIPFAMNVQIFYYRKDVFEEYDLEVPTTWDEMIAVSQELKDKGWEKDTYIAAYALPGGVTGDFQNFLTAMGGDWYEEGTNLPSFNNQIGLDSLEQIQAVFDEMPASCLSYSTDDVCLAIQTGEAVMTQMWATRMPSFQDPTVSNVVDLLGCTAPLALEEGGVPTNQLNWDALVIPKNVSGDPEAVFLAMAEMTCEEATMETAELSIPLRNAPTEADPTIYDRHPEFLALQESVTAGCEIYPYHLFPFFQLGADIVASYVNDAMIGNLEYQEALDRAETDILVLLTDMGYLE